MALSVTSLTSGRIEILLKGKGSSFVTFDPRPQEHCKLGKEEFRCDLLVLNQSSAFLELLVPSVHKIKHDHLYTMRSKRITGSMCGRRRGILLLRECLYPKSLVPFPKPIAWGRH